MVIQSNYKNDLRANFEPGVSLPKVSTKLDSVRAYQFEARFYGIPTEGGGAVGSERDLTAAAKKVSPIGGSTDDIVVDRVNDKMFYPGKFTPEAVTITFDNQLLTRTTPTLWNWFMLLLIPSAKRMFSLLFIKGMVSQLCDFQYFYTSMPHNFRREHKQLVNSPLNVAYFPVATDVRVYNPHIVFSAVLTLVHEKEDVPIWSLYV